MHQYLLIFIIIFSGAAIESRAASNKLHIVYTLQNPEFAKILTAFGKNTGLHVNAEFVYQNDLKQQLMAMTESRTAPDAVIIPSDQLGLHNYVEYSEVNARMFKTNISERLWSSCISDGKLYGTPLIQGNFLMLYYNKSLVQEPASDWQAMYAQKKELNAKGIQTISWPIFEAYYFLPFLNAFGGWPLSEGKVQLDTPAMVATLEFYKRLLSYKLFALDSREDVNKLFKEEKYAYTISGNWNGDELFRALGDKLGVSALPMAQGKKMHSSFSTYAIAFPYNGLKSNKRALLIQLVDYLQSTKIQQEIAVKMQVIPVEETAFANIQKKSPEYLKQTLILMADTKPLPADEAMSFIWPAINKGLEREKQGVLDSKGTAQYMQQLAERYIRNAQLKPQPTTKPTTPESVN